MSLFGSILLDLFSFLMKPSRWYWTLIYCVPFLGMMYARDSLFFSYPLLAGLISFKILFLKNKIESHHLLVFTFFYLRHLV